MTLDKGHQYKCHPTLGTYIPVDLHFDLVHETKCRRTYNLLLDHAKVVVHRLEEELVAGPVEDILKVGQPDLVRTHRELDCGSKTTLFNIIVR